MNGQKILKATLNSTQQNCNTNPPVKLTAVFTETIIHIKYHLCRSDPDTWSTTHPLHDVPILTLHVFCIPNRIFLAAKSRWTKDFLDRYSIPDAMLRQNFSSKRGRDGSQLTVPPCLQIVGKKDKGYYDTVNLHVYYHLLH